MACSLHRKLMARLFWLLCILQNDKRKFGIQKRAFLFQFFINHSISIHGLYFCCCSKRMNGHQKSYYLENMKFSSKLESRSRFIKKMLSYSVPISFVICSEKISHNWNTPNQDFPRKCYQCGGYSFWTDGIYNLCSKWRRSSFTKLNENELFMFIST